MRFPGGSDGKESACSAEDLGLTAGLGRFLGNGNPLQYSCPENSTDTSPWGHKESDTTKQLTHVQPITCMDHIWLLCSRHNGHLGCSHLWAVVCKWAANVHEQVAV